MKQLSRIRSTRIKIEHFTRKMKRRNWFQGIKTPSWVPKWP